MTAPVRIPPPAGQRMRQFLGVVPTWVVWLIVVLWTVPTFGLFVSSFRKVIDINESGWWTAWNDLDNLTLQNYRDIFRETAAQPSMWEFALNSMAIVIPATIIPIAVAAFAAYGFGWMEFRGRNWLFIALVSMIALPNQMAFVPLLQLFNNGARLTIPGLDWTFVLVPDLGIGNTAAAVWLTHTAFGLPLAVLLLHNFISQLPRSVFEAARIDGASHFTIFWRLVLPLARPALAAFAVFQFLWTWNDYLIAAVLLTDNEPMTVALVNLVGERGSNFQLRFASAFVIMVIPLVIFFSLQRHFVRGLLAGSVKG